MVVLVDDVVVVIKVVVAIDVNEKNLMRPVTRHTRRIFLMPANSSFPIVRLCAVSDLLLIRYQIQGCLLQMRFVFDVEQAIQ